MSPTPLPLSHRTVAVVGGDLRMLHAAYRLGEMGARIRLLALGDPTPHTCRPSETLSDVVRDADTLLLPLPTTRDGVTVNCPRSPNRSVTLDEVAALLRERPDLHLLGGLLPRALLDALPEGVRATDYYEDEALLLRNAYLTAEGALMLAMQETDCALRGKTAAIIGYGRIGKLLARLLLSVGMEVTVCARRRESLLWAAADGCRPLQIGDAARAGRGLFPLCCGHLVLFNTVPEQVLDRDLLLRLEPGTLLVDLASAPFGARDEDVREAERANGLRYIRAPGIPGQYAPRDAGYAIADCVAEALRRHPTPVKGEDHL